LGIPLQDCVTAVQQAEPFPGRMKPVALPSGATLIDDSWKAPLWSFPALFHFLQEAKAQRKILVIGTISDYRGDSTKKYLDIAKSALAVTDFVFFVGKQSARCLRTKQGPDDRRVMAFATNDQLAMYLEQFQSSGDLIILKASKSDNLNRLESRLRCAKPRETCSLTSPFPLPLPHPNGKKHCDGPDVTTSINTYSSVCDPARTTHVVIGLGNPNDRFADTRHNVGYRVVEELARRWAAPWKEGELALVASATFRDRSVLLVKLLSAMNSSGEHLRRLGQQLGLSVDSSMLIHDAMDLPVGQIRERMRGSSGGHNGVLSILTALQTEELPRVKIGLGQPPDRAQAMSHVLSDFLPQEQRIIQDSVSQAADRVEKLLERR
jgi:PTH1 family peptidyl-tRNA hydrolase